MYKTFSSASKNLKRLALKYFVWLSFATEFLSFNRGEDWDNHTISSMNAATYE